jgi:hypothetical protein
MFPWRGHCGWRAVQHRGDCAQRHSFPEGENIFWGGTWPRPGALLWNLFALLSWLTDSLVSAVVRVCADGDGGVALSTTCRSCSLARRWRGLREVMVTSSLIKELIFVARKWHLGLGELVLGVGFTQSRAGVVICEGAGRIWGIPRGVLGGGWCTVFLVVGIASWFRYHYLIFTCFPSILFETYKPPKF